MLKGKEENIVRVKTYLWCCEAKVHSGFRVCGAKMWLA